MKYYNDVAMLVDGKIVVMIEHQSTINENMPFRFLEYIARIYEKITNPKEKFERKLMKLPVPEFYVFYNGKEDFPSESEMKLSDAFILPEQKYSTDLANFPLEITVKVVNINIDKGNPILKRCKILDQYSEFIEIVRKSIDSGTADPFTTAISQAVKEGFLADYLARKTTEVENMLMTEYDYDTDIAVQREEAYEDGLNKGIKQGINQGAYEKAVETAKNLFQIQLSVEQIATVTGLSLEVIQSIKDSQEV